LYELHIYSPAKRQRPLADLCEYGNETSGYMKGGDFLNNCLTVMFSKITQLHGNR